MHLYLTNRETELTAYNNLKRLKNNGFKILITSPKPIPLDFYSLIDHYYYDSENQLLELEYDNHQPLIWWNSSGDVSMNFIVNGFQYHSLAVLRSMIKGSIISKSLGYTNIIRFEFDDFFGFNSLNKIKDICKEIEINEYDFYLFKNKNGTTEDISTHLMFYSANSFMKVFDKIQNEKDYKEYLKKIGFENKSMFLEQFMLKVIEKEELKILYQEGNMMQTIFNDTIFNIHQSPIGVFGGALSDVMRVDRNGTYVPDILGLTAKNISSELPVNIYFDIYNHQNNLIKTVKLHLQTIGNWKYEELHNTKNISEIKIRHQDKPHHKTFKVYMENDMIKINNIDINNDNFIPEIKFK
jgi:hypothetical protein